MKFGKPKPTTRPRDYGRLLHPSTAALLAAAPSGWPTLSRSWERRHPGAMLRAPARPTTPQEGPDGRRSAR